MSATNEEKDESELSALLYSEGHLRDAFEAFINALTAVKYSLDRDEHKEYKQAAVFHMWTGFCIASINSQNIKIEAVEDFTEKFGDELTCDMTFNELDELTKKYTNNLRI